MCRLGLPEVAHPIHVHNLKTLVSAVLRKPSHTGDHYVLADAQATLTLYTWDTHKNRLLLSTKHMFLSNLKDIQLDLLQWLLALSELKVSLQIHWTAFGK